MIVFFKFRSQVTRTGRSPYAAKPLRAEKLVPFHLSPPPFDGILYYRPARLSNFAEKKDVYKRQVVRQMEADREACCDHLVLEALCGRERIEYGHVLLSWAGRDKAVAAVGMGSGRTMLHRRILRIASYKPCLLYTSMDRARYRKN